MMPVEVQNADGSPVRGGRRRRRSGGWARRRRAALALALVAAVAIVAGVGFQIFHSAFQVERPDTVDERLAVAASDRAETVNTPGARTARTVYPFSIVPGGVYRPDEAKAAAAKDPVVAEHYREFAFDAMRVETVTRPRAVYVSYRVGNQVYWTKRPLTLHPGELLLTDGTREVRARCGNRISDEAQEPVSTLEPSIEAFEQAAPIVVPEEPGSHGFIGLNELVPLSGLAVSSEPRVADPSDPGSFSGPLMALSGLPGGSDMSFIAANGGIGIGSFTPVFNSLDQTVGLDQAAESIPDGPRGAVSPNGPRVDANGIGPRASSFVALSGSDTPPIGGGDPGEGRGDSLLPGPGHVERPGHVTDPKGPGAPTDTLDLAGLPPGDDGGGEGVSGLEAAAAVPEPSTLLLVGGVLAGAALLRRRTGTRKP